MTDTLLFVSGLVIGGFVASAAMGYLERRNRGDE